MQTTIYEVIFFNGSKFYVFCSGKAQIKRFWKQHELLKNEIQVIIESIYGIHTITEFEKITTN